MIELPGLFGAVKNVVSQQVALVCVIPHDIVIPIIPNVDQVKLRFPEPDVMKKFLKRLIMSLKLYIIGSS